MTQSVKNLRYMHEDLSLKASIQIKKAVLPCIPVEEETRVGGRVEAR